MFIFEMQRQTQKNIMHIGEYYRQKLIEYKESLPAKKKTVGMEELARKVGCTVVTLYNIERGMGYTVDTLQGLIDNLPKSENGAGQAENLPVL